MGPTMIAIGTLHQIITVRGMGMVTPILALLPTKLVVHVEGVGCSLTFLSSTPRGVLRLIC